MTVSLGPNIGVEYAAEVLAHELVHASFPSVQRVAHGELFRRRLIAVTREAFGLNLDTAALLSMKPGTQKMRAYAIDRAIHEEMCKAGVGEKLRADPETRFESPAEETPLEVAARLRANRERLIEKRAQHARAMADRWERKLSAAKRVASKWRAKVRYYDRQAAKRGIVYKTGGR